MTLRHTLKLPELSHNISLKSLSQSTNLQNVL
uniref:Uncharacterized protein n=1 Tax=Anguilla anguilla TaxID=7936 RepID=A0A0E9UPP3_ANGAN